MASNNPAGNGNGYSGRGSHYTRHRNRPNPNRNARSSNENEGVSSTTLDGTGTNSVSASKPNSESYPSTSAVPRPRRGRGYSSGPPRNGFGRQFRGSQNHFENSQRNGFTPRNGSEMDAGQQLLVQPDERNFPRNLEHNQQQIQQYDSSRGTHTRSEPSSSRATQRRDQDANSTGYATSYPEDHFSHYAVGSTELYQSASSLQGGATSSTNSRFSGGESSTRPKQSNRGMKRTKFKNPDYRKVNAQSDAYVEASGVTYENSSYQPANYALSNVVASVATLEYQPYDNIRRDYSQYGSRSTFAEPHFEGRGRSKNPKERFRRDDRNPRDVGYNANERFSRDESSGSYGSKDRVKLDGPGPTSSLSDREHTSYNKPEKSYDSQNWRSDAFKKGFAAQKQKKIDAAADTATQRERLTTQLTSGTYECMVCCESVKPVQPIWNCTQCYHVFHLGCVRRWSRTSQDESGQWRCPGCQSTNKSLPTAYFCYCLKRKDPEWNRREIPHSCGEVCGKALGDGVGCTHNCTLLCHPGPCPTCSAQTQRKCPCGKSSQLVKCGSTDPLLCGEPCEKKLTCGLHTCQEACHVGLCETCSLTVKQVCFCSQSERSLPCSVDHPEEEKFSCELVCGKKLTCGRHQCEERCHPGECEPCRLEVSTVTSCPCGKLKLKELYKTKSIPERKSCTDPIPTCEGICGKMMTCGPAENPHSCQFVCHSGPCPPCPLSSLLRCRCGRNEKKFLCKNLSDLGEVLCERRCNKKRQCGRHKCAQVCCVDKEHICPMVCGRTLSCGLDRCEALCHAGNCNRCYRVSFDELRCHCGTQVMYPPVPCGTRPPDCTKPCTRVRPCGHPPSHNCHPEANGCPPCTTLCEKFCYGKHEKRKNIPCHLNEVSCGKACGRPMKCGRHTCPVTCHAGPCPVSCTQPCPVQRSDCDHPCGLPCHEGACPGTACREKIKVQCQCGQRTATVSCEENELSYRKMATGLLASKMAQLQSGECVDLKDLLGKSAANKNKSLECNEECALVERNRRLALALQIKNPNPKPGAPPYPDLLKEWAKKDQRFVQMVHDKLTELVQLAKQSVGKMKSRSHSFDSMNRDKRQFIHEYCVFFGCESMSYDEEPKRNVVATAFGELSFLPAVSILDVTRRELGQRKMPAPPRGTGLTVLSSGLQAQQQQVPQQTQQPPNAWGTSKSSAPFRTLSDVVKSTPAIPKHVPESPGPSKSSDPKPPMVDYFDFTS